MGVAMAFGDELAELVRIIPLWGRQPGKCTRRFIRYPGDVREFPDFGTCEGLNQRQFAEDFVDAGCAAGAFRDGAKHPKAV